jgi:hypothetical protein
MKSAAGLPYREAGGGDDAPMRCAQAVTAFLAARL